MESSEPSAESLFEKTLMLQGMISSVATGGGMIDQEYRAIRSELMGDEAIRALIPRFIIANRDTQGIWAHMKSVHSGGGAYSVRREYISEAFADLLLHLEDRKATPSDTSISDVLAKYDAIGVQSAWTKALKRRLDDPEGAITSARTLLEEVCKHILEDSGRTGSEKWDLPKLYSETSKILNLAPSQHTEDVFKRILGGCNTIVENLGGLRNKLSDAHASGRRSARPAPRHAALSVKLAGSMAMFLIETWLERDQSER